MRLQGLRHITMITADAPENVTFYADVLGLRLVKKTVNFDQPDAATSATSAGRPGAGTAHHIAWACRDEDQLAWQALVREAGRHVTEVLDRDYFRSVYFREPRHVLFEIATLSPGFDVDENTEHLRARLEQLLTPLENPRAPASGEDAA